MGLISRVSSRTYRIVIFQTSTKKINIKMFVRRFLTTSAIKRSDPIQAIYVSKIKEYANLASAGKLDQAGVQAEIDVAKARLGGSGDMTAFPKLSWEDQDHSEAAKFEF